MKKASDLKLIATYPDYYRLENIGGSIIRFNGVAKGNIVATLLRHPEYKRLDDVLRDLYLNSGIGCSSYTGTQARHIPSMFSECIGMIQTLKGK